MRDITAKVKSETEKSLSRCPQEGAPGAWDAKTFSGGSRMAVVVLLLAITAAAYSLPPAANIVQAGVLANEYFQAHTTDLQVGSSVR